MGICYGARPKTDGDRAFTLVELIVVVGIVVVLAALLFPVAWRVRQQARVAVCVSNLHEIGVAIAVYVRDYGDTMPLVSPMQFYPPHNPPQPPPPQPPGWDVASVALGDYISTPQTFVCPATGQPYWFNPSVSGMSVPPVPHWAGPALTLLMYDSESNVDLLRPHLGRLNAVFLDGHVKAYGWVRPMPPAPNVKESWFGFPNG